MVKKGIMIGPTGLNPCAGAINRKKHPLKLFSIILDPALNWELHLESKTVNYLRILITLVMNMMLTMMTQTTGIPRI